MWKAPERPNHKITQTFNSGLVRIYALEDVAEPGRKPTPQLVHRYTLPYDERRLGIQRYYAAAQNQLEVQRVIRVPAQNISSQQVAVTEDGGRYRIDLVQTAEVYPPSLDLTLVQYTQGPELEE